MTGHVAIQWRAIPIVVHLAMVRACIIAIAHASTAAIVHAYTMAIVHACTVAIVTCMHSKILSNALVGVSNGILELEI